MFASNPAGFDNGDNCKLLPIVTGPLLLLFDLLIGGYQFFTNQCQVYLQLLLIGIDLVIQAPKSPEFTYMVFHGIA